MDKKEGGWKILYPERDFSDSQPVITIITAVFNSAHFFEETILSIVSQTYNNLEYIVVDGGSTDGTLDIIKKYDDQIAYWVSEPDAGISDAFNKAIKLSKGSYINFQGAGDLLETNRVLESMFSDLKNYPTFVAGRIKRVDGQDSNMVFYLSDDFTRKKFKPSSLFWRMSLPHQGLFTHRSYFDQYGLFNTSLRYSMDYEHLLRSYHKFPQIIFADVVSRWRADGLGNNKELEIYREYDLIKRMHKIEPSYQLLLVNCFILLKHKIKRVLLNR
jgi:glycosyltransferase involved in cell wall biosynthesis